MASYPPAFARLWGKKVHKRDALLERLTREILDDDPRDAAAAKAWLSKWEDYASRSWTRQNTAQKSLLALKEAVAKGEVLRDDIPYALHTELPRKCKPEFLLRFAEERGLARWESIIELIDSVKKTCKKKAAALRKMISEADSSQKEAVPKSEPKSRKRKEKEAATKPAEGEARRPPEPRRKKSAETDALRVLLKSLDESVATKLLAEVNMRYPTRVEGRLLDLPNMTWFEWCWVRDRATKLAEEWDARQGREEPDGETRAKAPPIDGEEPDQLRETELSRSVGALAILGVDGNNSGHIDILEEAWDSLPEEQFDALKQDHFGEEEIVLCEVPRATQRQYLLALQRALRVAAYNEERAARDTEASRGHSRPKKARAKHTARDEKARQRSREENDAQAPIGGASLSQGSNSDELGRGELQASAASSPAEQSTVWATGGQEGQEDQEAAKDLCPEDMLRPRPWGAVDGSFIGCSANVVALWDEGIDFGWM